MLNYLITRARVLGVEGERNFAELFAVFFNLKIGDEILRFEMFKEFNDDVSGVEFFLGIGVC